MYLKCFVLRLKVVDSSIRNLVKGLRPLSFVIMIGGLIFFFLLNSMASKLECLHFDMMINFSHLD
jgi:hypothetical protein